MITQLSESTVGNFSNSSSAFDSFVPLTKYLSTRMEHLEWEMQEALYQIEILLASKRTRQWTDSTESLSGTSLVNFDSTHRFLDLTISPKASFGLLATIPSKIIQRLSGLDRVGENDSLNVLSRWVAQFSPDSRLCPLVGVILGFFSLYAEPLVDEDTRSIIGYPSENSVEDNLQSSGNDVDDTVGHYLLQLLFEILTSYVHNAGTGIASSFHMLTDVGSEDIAERLVQFLFDKLSYFYSPYIRHKAARCLSLLSLHIGLLETILRRFQLSFAISKKKKIDERAFSFYQGMVSHLAFGLGPGRIDLTLSYLTALAKSMRKVEKGVLRNKVCLSLKQIFSKLLSPQDEISLEELESLSESPLAPSFWNVYHDIFSIVSKWSKKRKSSIFCYDLMSLMVCYGNQEFFLSNMNSKESILDLIVSGMKKDDLRSQCLVLAEAYVHEMNVSFVSDDYDSFYSQMKLFLFSGVLAKKRCDTETDNRVIVDTLINFGRQHLHFFATEIATEILKLKSHFSESHKAATLAALSVLARECRGDIEEYDFQLGPLVCAFISDPDLQTDRSTLIGAVRCFPYIRHPQLNLAKVTAKSLVALSVSIDSELASASTLALQMFALVNPIDHLLPTFYFYLDRLQCPCIPPQSGQQFFEKLSLLFGAYSDLLIAQIDVFHIPRGAWVAMRQRTEGVCLLWISHIDYSVRQAALSTLQFFDTECFRSIETLRNSLVERVSVRLPSIDVESSEPQKNHLGKRKTIAETIRGKKNALEASAVDSACNFHARDIILEDMLGEQHYANAPFMIDKLKICCRDDADSQFSPQLLEFLESYFPQFKGVITYTWSLLLPQGNSFLEELVSFESDVPTTTSEGFRLFLNHLKILSFGYRPTLEFEVQPNGPIPLAEFWNIESLRMLENKSRRLCLSNLVIESSHYRKYASVVFKLLHEANSTIVCDLIDSLQFLHPLAYDTIFLHIRHPIMRRTGHANSSGSYNLITDYFLHLPTIHTYARLLVKTGLTIQSFRSPSKVALFCAEFVEKWTFGCSAQNLASLSNDLRSSMSVILRWHCLFSAAHVLLRHNDVSLDAKSAPAEDAHQRLFEVPWQSDVSISRSTVSFLMSQHTRDNALKLGISLDELIAKDNRSTYFNFIMHTLIPFDIRSMEDFQHSYERKQCIASEVSRVSAETNWLLCITAFTNMGPFPEGVFDTSMLHMLEFMCHRGEHLRELVQQSLSRVLFHNRHLFSMFLEKSIAPRSGVNPDFLQSTDAQGIDAIAITYFRSLCTKIDRAELITWVRNHGMHPAGVLLFSLYFLCFPNAGVRQDALLLLNNLTVGFDELGVASLYVKSTPLFVDVLPHVYKKQTITISRRFSEDHYHLLPEFFFFARDMGRLMDSSSLETLLSISIPWIKQFGRLVSDADVVVSLNEPGQYSIRDFPMSDRVVSFLDALMELSLLCRGVSLLSYFVRDMWTSLLHLQKFLIPSVQAVVFYLVAKFAESVDPAVDAACRDILLYLCRMDDKVVSEIVLRLVSKLRDYDNRAPVEPKAFILWITEREDDLLEPTTSYEVAAYELICNVIFEFPMECRPYFPVLLNASFVLMVGNDRAVSVTLVLKFILISQGVDVGSRDLLGIEAFSALLLSKDTKLLQEWASIAFAWSLNSTDPRIRESSFEIVRVLNTFVSSDSLLRSVLTCYLSIVDSRSCQIMQSLSFFIQVSEFRYFTSLEWTLLLSASFCLLCISDPRIYDLANELVLKLLCIGDRVEIDLATLIRALVPVFSFTGTKTTITSHQVHLDIGIFNAFSRGLHRNGSSIAILHVLNELLPSLASDLPSFSCRSCVLVVLSLLMKYGEVLNDPYNFILSSNYKSLESDYLSQCLNEFEDFVPFRGLLSELECFLREFFRGQSNELTEDLSKDMLQRNRSKDSALVAYYIKDHLDHSAYLLSRIYSTQDEYEFILLLFIELIQFGELDWRVSLLVLVSSFMKHSRVTCSKFLYAQICEVLASNCLSDDVVLADEALWSSKLVVESTPSDITGDLFHFIRPKSVKR